MQTERVGPLAAIIAGRPLVLTIVVAFAAMALAATAWRAGAHFPAGDRLLTAFVAGGLTAILLALPGPRRVPYRLCYMAVLLLAIFGVAMVREPLAPLAAAGVDVSVVGIACFAAAVLVAGAPLWRAELGLVFAPAAALAMALGGSVAGAAQLDAAVGEWTVAALTLALAGGLGAAVFLATFALREFAAGGDFRRAVAVSLRERSGVLVFVLALTGLTIAARTPPDGLATPLAAAAFLFAAGAGAGLGALALARPGEAAVDFVNARGEGLRRALAKVRPFMPASACLAAMAITGIVCFVILFERPVADAGELFIVAGAATVAAAVGFFSIRAGLFVGALAVMSGLIGAAASSLLGAPASSEALAVTLIAVGPLASEWRESRGLRRKAWRVTETALTGAGPAYLLSLVLTGLVLAIAAPAGAGTGSGALLAFVIQAGLTSLLAAPVMVAYGALLGRD